MSKENYNPLTAFTAYRETWVQHAILFLLFADDIQTSIIQSCIYSLVSNKMAE